MARNIKDALLLFPKALPAAGATSYTDSFDLTHGGDVPEDIELIVTAPTAAALANTKAATYRIEESDDDSSFADAPWSPVITQTGAGGTGAAGITQRLRPPSSAKRYHRLQIDVEAEGGTLTALSASLEVRT